MQRAQSFCASSSTTECLKAAGLYLIQWFINLFKRPPDELSPEVGRSVSQNQITFFKLLSKNTVPFTQRSSRKFVSWYPYQNFLVFLMSVTRATYLPQLQSLVSPSSKIFSSVPYVQTQTVCGERPVSQHNKFNLLAIFWKFIFICYSLM